MWAAAVATLAGGPGIVRRRAWPAALVLLPVGAYLLARAQVAVPSDVHGAWGQLAFYVEQLRSGGKAYALDVFPLDVADKADVRLLLSLVMYAAIWLAAFLALSLRKPLPAIVVLLVLLGFGFTTDASARNVWATMAFLLLAGSMLVLSRSLQRERWKSTDIAAGAITATIAAVLALSIIGATSVEAGRPLRDWRAWDIVGVGSTHLRFDWMQNYPRLLDPAANERVMRVRSAVPSYWRANALAHFDGASWWSDTPESPPVKPVQKRGSYVYAIPPAGLEPPGRVVTETFEIESTYTNDLFIGGLPSSLQIARPVDLRVGDGGGLNVDPPLGPKLSYAVTALVPRLEPSDLIERGRAYPSDVLARYTDLPFPTLQQLDGRSPEAVWNKTMGITEFGREWQGCLPPERLDRRRSDRSLPDRPRRRGVPALQIHLLAQAPRDGLCLALRGVPVQDQDRILPALRRRDGDAAPVQRHPGSRRGRVHHRGEGRRRHLRRDAQRRARLGRGVLPGGRLGAVRPDPRPGAARLRGRADERTRGGDRRPEPAGRLGHPDPLRRGRSTRPRQEPCRRRR